MRKSLLLGLWGCCGLVLLALGEGAAQQKGPVRLSAFILDGGAAALGTSQDQGGLRSKEGKLAQLKAKEIPLDIVYSTNGQKGLIPVRRGTKAPYDACLGEMFRRSGGMGASNIFLVKGNDITEAITATSTVFIGGNSAERPARGVPPYVESAKCWLVAYLGMSERKPPAWAVVAVEKEGKTFRLYYYGRQPPGRIPEGKHHYFAWVPLGDLEAGRYDLELIEAGKRSVVLRRRVEVQRGSAAAQREEATPVKGGRPGATETREIPLKKIYSTNRQNGLIPVRFGFGEPYDDYMGDIYTGASNIFLVRGDNITDAIKGTTSAFCDGRGVDFPPSLERPRGQKLKGCWLVAYLGIQGSEPPGWLVNRVVRAKDKLRIIATKELSRTKDGWHYLVWVPVGRLKPGTYTLDLVNATSGETTLTRRVKVE